MLSIMNEIDPCLLLPLRVLYEIQNQIYQQYIPLANTSKKKVVVTAAMMAKRGGGFVVRSVVDFLRV